LPNCKAQRVLRDLKASYRTPPKRSADIKSLDV
jgi:hypothetical protein